MARSPWPGLLRLAAEHFAISPAAFWRLSLAEWLALTAADETVPLGRSELDALLSAIPDDPRSPS